MNGYDYDIFSTRIKYSYSLTTDHTYFDAITWLCLRSLIYYLLYALHLRRIINICHASTIKIHSVIHSSVYIWIYNVSLYSAKLLSEETEIDFHTLLSILYIYPPIPFNKHVIRPSSQLRMHTILYPDFLITVMSHQTSTKAIHGKRSSSLREMFTVHISLVSLLQYVVSRYANALHVTIKRKHG